MWRGTAVDAGDATPTTIDVLAGRDGAGRPALYHRTLPWARQPWLAEVTGFAVLAVHTEVGAWGPAIADGATRWTAVRVEVAWTDGDIRTYEVALPHAPCGVAP